MKPEVPAGFDGEIATVEACRFLEAFLVQDLDIPRGFSHQLERPEFLKDAIGMHGGHAGRIDDLDLRERDAPNVRRS